MKMRTKRLLTLGITAVTAASLLAGCGKSADEKKDTKKSESDGILTVGFWGSSGEDEAVKASLEGVEEAVEGLKEVKLEQYSTVNDFYDKLPGQIAAGTAPDIIIATNEQHLQLIADGAVAELDGYDFDFSGYAQNAVEAWQYEGKQYGIPITAAPSTFAVNTDMWKEAGLKEYPATWEEVYEAAKVLTKDDRAGICIDVGNIYHPTQYMNSFGGGWKDGKSINSDENVKALEYIFKMFDEGLAVTAKDAGMTWDGEVFAGGKCAMSTGGTWYVNTMRESAPDTNYSFIPMPGGDGNVGCTLHTYGIAVLSGTEDIDMAANTAYYMSRQEAQEKRAELIGDRPSIEAALPVFREMNPNLNVIDEYIDSASSFGYPADQAFKTEFTTILENHIYNGDKTDAKELLDTLADTFGTK